MSLDHTPPAPFPKHHLTGVQVPSDFAQVIVAAAEKSGRLFQDQLLHWAQMGAECERRHQEKPLNPRKRK